MSLSVQTGPSSLRPAAQDFVEGTLNYLQRPRSKPVNYAITPPPGVSRRGGESDPRRVRIANARWFAAPPTLDVQGFELVQQPSRTSDFRDDAAIVAQYYPEVESLLRRVTGASAVRIFDHTRRYALSDHGEAGVREPASSVHNDQTFVSGPRRVRDHLPPDEAGARLGRRHAIVNVWRATDYPAETWPLALCDARTLSPEDFIPTDLVYADKVGETYGFLYDPRHRWSYFPRATPEEALLLKIYDSRLDVARLTAHTAFEDPTARADAPPRRSIEVRALVFWD